MSYETLNSATSAEDIQKHQEDFGRYNDAPPGFQEITSEEFSQSGFFTWCFMKFEFRQIVPERIDQSKMISPVKGMLSVKMFYMNHGDGYALAQDYWGKKVRYFKFAKCYHDYQEIGSRGWNCYHVCKCTKCGEVWEYDSSG